MRVLLEAQNKIAGGQEPFIPFRRVALLPKHTETNGSPGIAERIARLFGKVGYETRDTHPCVSYLRMATVSSVQFSIPLFSYLVQTCCKVMTTIIRICIVPCVCVSPYLSGMFYFTYRMNSAGEKKAFGFIFIPFTFLFFWGSIQFGINSSSLLLRRI